MGTVTGTLVSEGGPRPSIAFVHDDPTLCSAAEWWSGVARVSAAVLVPFALVGAAAALVAGASLASFALWVLAGAAGGAGVRLVVAALTRRQIVLREAGDALVGPVPGLRLSRFALAVIARAWVVWPAIALPGGQATPGHALVAAAWAPVVVAAWAASGAGVMAVLVRRAEERRDVRLLFPAGLRQRVAAGHVLHTAPR
ncbi:MAG: hypothetical protein ACRDQE_10235 [Gaiellales bacterium]